MTALAHVGAKKLTSIRLPVCVDPLQGRLGLTGSSCDIGQVLRSNSGRKRDAEQPIHAPLFHTRILYACGALAGPHRQLPVVDTVSGGLECAE